MATSHCTTLLLKSTSTLALKSTIQCGIRPYSWTKILYRSASQNVRSSLYEHVRSGYSHKPILDMSRVCDETDQVVAEVDKRKGDLRGEDVRDIVSSKNKQAWCFKRNKNMM